jgi:sucrose-6-phosphate hydrolase SacC (GH32 family)
MFQWKKLGKIFSPQAVADRPWLKEFAQAPATLIFDDFVRVYFSCRPSPDANGRYVSYSAYVDLERKDLTRIRAVADNPIMPLGELGAFDEFGVYPVSVAREGDEIRAYYGGWTRCESTPYTVAIGMALSHDQGRTFTRVGPGPLLAQTPSEAFVLSGPKVRRFNDQWYLWYVAGVRWAMQGGRAESIYRIRMARSSDGVNWHRDGRDLLDIRLEEDECQASPDVIRLGGRYHMFYCYKYGVDFRNSARGYRIGYAVSDDLEHWIRDDSLAGIDVSPAGWDSESIAYPHVFELDGEVYMLYLGNEVGRGGFGLAKLEGRQG